MGIGELCDRPLPLGHDRVGAALLCLARLGCQREADLIIEGPCDVAEEERPRADSGGEEDRPIVEDDLVVQEIEAEDAGDDAWHRALAGLPPLWAPRSNKGRQLMKARAQQCIICLTEKEHTFVPAHREGSPRRVEGHRFCTGCWAEFLQHGLQQQGASPLVCPVCRGAVDVPDVYGALCVLPDEWQRKRGCGPSEPSSPSRPAAGLQRWRQSPRSAFWADAAPAAAADWCDRLDHGAASGSAPARRCPALGLLVCVRRRVQAMLREGTRVEALLPRIGARTEEATAAVAGVRSSR